jgi:hypothetical protein
MGAKFRRAHPRLGPMLAWAEDQAEPITLTVEIGSSEPDVNSPAISEAIFDILLERTGSTLFDKRRNAGQGRGLEFWRILKRDFGTSSSDARMAKLQMYMKPTRCHSLAELGPALDKWEVLGGELGRQVDDELRLLALNELIPKTLADTMSAQSGLKNFPEAVMFVRRSVAKGRHALQVVEVQRQQRHGPVPMDVSSLMNLIELLRGETDHYGQTPYAVPDSNFRAVPDEGDPNQSPFDQVLAALKGKGKGRKGKWSGPTQTETRECYECGQKGHLARDCPKGGGKGATVAGATQTGQKGGGKGGKGKLGKGIRALGEEGGDEPEAISLGCLLKAAPTSLPIGAVGRQGAETWNGYTKVEATVDSGAAECVCGVNHFDSVLMNTDDNRTGAGVEYICADGGRIPNLGEKRVQGLTTEGSKLNVTFQVAPVDRPLLSVEKLTAGGHVVNFEKNGGTITHVKTGAVTAIRRSNGVFVIDIWVPTFANAKPGGTRQ